MIKRLGIAVLVSVFGMTSSADDIVVLRAQGAAQGLARFDRSSQQMTPIASFVYRAAFSAGLVGRLHLASIEDRLIAQGSSFFEFDAVTGQLLRKYPALDLPFGTWAFHAVAINSSRASQTGLPTGYYGFPVCPRSSNSTGLGCDVPPTPLPGYTDQSNLTHYEILLRRSLDPADTALHVAKVFSNAAIGKATEKRLITFDADRQQFWFTLQGTDNTDIVERLTRAPIVDGQIADETLVSERRMSVFDTPDALHGTTSFTFVKDEDAFFKTAVWYYSLEQGIARSTEAGEQFLLRLPDGNYFDAITTLSDETPAEFIQVLPVADGPGANGTYWRSDAYFYNPSSDSMKVTIGRVTRQDVALTVTLGPRASIGIPAILEVLGGGAKKDGVSIDALTIHAPYRTAAQLSVYSRTYTQAPGGGTYGQAIPAVPSLLGYSNHDTFPTHARDISDTQAVFLLDKRNPAQFRHNFGVVNTADAPLTIRLRYAVVTENPIDMPDVEEIITVPGHSVRQYLLEALFPEYVTSTYPPRVWFSADRPAVVWLSIVDNRTGDASFVPFTQYGVEAEESSVLAFPVVAYTPGANGTFWQTDVYGVFASAAGGGAPQTPAARFAPSGATVCGAREFHLQPAPGARVTSNFDWNPFWYTIFPDVARQACPNSNDVRGGLSINTGSWTSAFSRTYTTTSDGGTYGEILPLYPPRGWPVRHFPVELRAGQRVNVGLFNGSAATADVRLKLVDQNGASVVDQIITMRPGEQMQSELRHLVGALPDGIYGLSFSSTSGTWPYVSTVDNITGDPTNWW